MRGGDWMAEGAIAEEQLEEQEQQDRLLEHQDYA
jgi:hypothetical protein